MYSRRVPESTLYRPVGGGRGVFQKNAGGRMKVTIQYIWRRGEPERRRERRCGKVQVAISR